VGVWILTQMKRWGYIEGDIDYAAVAEQVYLAADCGKVMADLGLEVPTETYKSHMIMGKTFDPTEPEAYVESFAIRRT
jgi:nitrate/nitrite transport system substrate-binding protein